MKMLRVLIVCLLLCLTFCELVASATNTENVSAQSTAPVQDEEGSFVQINDESDLKALGIDSPVEFIDGEEDAVELKNAKNQIIKETASAPELSPSAISPDVPAKDTKAKVQHYGDCIEGDAADVFGTENNVNSTSEANITETTTWHIWGSCRIDYTINVYPGKSLTIFIKKRRVITDSYGGNEVARLSRGSNLAKNAPMFRVYRGAKLYIYGVTEANLDTISSYNEYYHLQITNGDNGNDAAESGAIIDFVNDTSEAGYESTGYATLVCKRVTFRNSYKSGTGAGIVINAPISKFDLKWCGFRNLKATHGAGIYVSNACTHRIDDFIVKECRFDVCKATDGYGGAIAVAIGCDSDAGTNNLIKITTMDLRGTTFDECTATDNGGAISIRGRSNASTTTPGQGTQLGLKDVSGSGLLLDDCVFQYCKSGSNGGAMFTSARFTLIRFNNATFTACESGAGGSAFYLGEETVINSFTATGATFNGCKGATNNTNYGGAVRTVGFAAVNATLTNCTFTNNTSQDGAGIYWNSGRVYNGTTYIVSAPSITIDGCTFNGNTASRNGGAIYNEAKMTIKNTKIYSNKADVGAGISIRNYNNKTGNLPDDLSLVLDSTTSIYKNTATSRGGGISFILRDSVMEESASYNPGERINFKLILNGAKIYSNTALNGGDQTKASYGGGISFQALSGADTFYDFEVQLKTGSIYSNSAKFGGGISAEAEDRALNIVVEGGTIGGNGTPNEAWAYGGGVYLLNSDVTLKMSNGDITYNVAKLSGGGVFADNGSHVEYSGGNLSYNSTQETNGGAIYVKTGTAKFTGGTISHNSAANNGGGVFVNGGKIEFTGGEISNNTAKANGGGVYLTASSAVFTGGTISDNLAEDRGGGVFADSSSTVEMSPVTAADGTVTGYATVTKNIANGSGGGVFVAGSSKITISEGIVSYNKALKNANSSGNGGGIAMSSGTIVVNGGSFYGNEALKGSGGGIMATGVNSSVSVYGGTIGSVDDISLANSASKGGGIQVQNGASLTVSDGCIGYNKALYVYDANGVLDSATGVGGGIAVFSCNATITGGTVIGNQADNKGGGIYVYSANQTESVTFSDGTIGVDADGNPAANIANYGGGVYVNNAIFNMTKSGDVSGAITNNVAIVDGGGLYVAFAPVTIAGNISDNMAANNGGGVYLENAAINFTGDIHSNKAGYSLVADGASPVEGKGNGGGIYVASDYQDDATVQEAVINGTISNNYANLNGGGVYAKGGTVVTVNGGDIHSNEATNGNGGGVYATEENTFIEILGGNIGLEEKPNIALNGGGVYIDGAEFILDRTGNTEGSIGYNLALENGGGGYFYSTTVDIKGNINDNTAYANGGGIYLTESTVTVEGDISNNRSVSVQGLRATVDSGGGAYLINSSVLNMGADGNITGNTTDGNGGGIAAYAGSTVNLGGGVITLNTANYGNGGGVYADASTVEITGSNIVENSALNGGGIAANSNSTVNLGGGLIKQNTASNGFGGGVYANDSVVKITGSDINANSAKNGGGVCVTNGGNLVMLGGLLRYNTAIGTPEDTVTTAYHLDETLAGVGGGVYLSNGVEAELSTYELTGTDNKFGIYGNLADFAADDVFANGVNTQLTLPRALTMTLKDTEFERATGWFEDYAKDDTEYANGLNGNPDIGGERYKTAERTVVAYVSEADAADKATESTVYINTANTYVCLTLGVAKAGYGELTIMKSGISIDPDQLFVFTVSGYTTESNRYVEYSVTVKGAGSVTIVDVPDGEYTVTEMTQWSWRYNLANIVVSNGSVDIESCSGTVEVGAADASPDIEFFNNLVKNSWLDGNSDVAKNVAGTANQNRALVAFYPMTADLPRKEQLV
ncbi:MAG: hypothetical protein IJB65_02460 [Clostridia bacterium]|nr:hypothetical protein [Clostridia bacterium]